MPVDDAPADLDSLLHLAAVHDLELDPETVHTEEMGLDLRVAVGRVSGAPAVL